MFALIRHGAHHIYPDHLTSEGEEAILALAERLSQLRGWSRMVASPRIRTRETAAIIGRVLALPVEFDDALLEMADHGPWMPPNTYDGTILVTHVPAIREIGLAWAKVLSLTELPRIEVAEGLLIDRQASTIKKISSL